MKRYREVIGGSVFFLFAATYFVMAFQIPTFNDGFISSDFMPKVYGTILMLLSVIQSSIKQLLSTFLTCSKVRQLAEKTFLTS